MHQQGKINVNQYIWDRLEASNTRFIINFGGAGSGKSYTQGQFEVLKTFEKAQTILVIRKVASTLIDSCIPLVVNMIIPNMNAGNLFSFNKTERILKNNVTGSQILFRGLDDPEKIKSIAGITRIWIEEASELTQEDFNQLNLRLRGAENLQMVLTFNPINESHWIKKYFFDNEDRLLQDEITIIKSTYKNNPFIDSNYHKVMQTHKKYDYNYYRVYALGEWGKLDTGAEFYKSFNVAFNVAKNEYINTEPLHLSFDENVNPYQAVTIWQTKDNVLRQIDEICLEQPRNSLQYVITEIERKYFNHTGGMFIYGDATSRKADAKLEKGYNFFTLISKGLAHYYPKLRVPLSNPPVMIRGMFLNQIFQKRFKKVEIIIGENCKNTIEDLRYVKEASDGTKLKEKAKDMKTGVSYEKYGHCSDTVDYFVCFYLNKLFNEFQHGDSTNKRVALKVSSGVEY